MESHIDALMTPELLAQFASLLGFSVQECELLGKVENFVYGYRVADQQRIMRVTHSSHRTVDEIEAELEWIRFLYNQGVSVSLPLIVDNNRFIKTYPLSEGAFYLTAFQRAPGEHITVGQGSVWGDKLFEAWGREIGKMHNAATRFEVPDNRPRRPQWHEEPFFRPECYLGKDDREVIRIARDVINEVAALPCRANNFGLIHGDLHNGNFCYQNGQITIFDFDDSAYHWFAYDIAVVLFTLLSPAQTPSEKSALMKQFLDPFIQGYNAANEFDDDWLKQMPLWFKLRDIMLYVFIYKKWQPKPTDGKIWEIFQKYRNRILLQEPLFTMNDN